MHRQWEESSVHEASKKEAALRRLEDQVRALDMEIFNLSLWIHDMNEGSKNLASFLEVYWKWADILDEIDSPDGIAVYAKQFYVDQEKFLELMLRTGEVRPGNLEKIRRMREEIKDVIRCLDVYAGDDAGTEYGDLADIPKRSSVNQYPDITESFLNTWKKMHQDQFKALIEDASRRIGNEDSPSL